MKPDFISEEELLLRNIQQFIMENPEGPGASEKEALQELVSLRTQLATAKEEDKGAILQQFDQLSYIVKQIRDGRVVDLIDPDCPYFAHMRINDKRGERDLFLGRASRLAPGIRIVDWRNAPVSRVFYRYQEGDEFEEEVGQLTLTGRVKIRRTLGIKSGNLNRIDTPKETWIRDDNGWEQLENSRPDLEGGSGQSFRAHVGADSTTMGIGKQHRADKRLPEIAALIDPHQFELITKPGSGLVAIRGGAGSGKTTVALHRIAYLAFADKNRFRPATMMVLVFGKALSLYVSHVLPALGVEGVRVWTWEKWAEKARTIHYKRLPKGHRDNTPAIVAKIKLHPVFEEIITEMIRARKADPTPAEAMDDFFSILMRGEEVVAKIADRAPNDFLPGRLQKAGLQLVEQGSALRAWLDGDREADAGLDLEDDAVLLRIWQLRVGYLRNEHNKPLKYSHIVIDEIQDFSAMEVKVVLGTLGKEGSATFAGDTAQHIVEGTGFTNWDTFFKHLGISGTVIDTLRISYRSTAQIAKFANSLLLDQSELEASPKTVRNGPPVDVFHFTDHGACVAFLADSLHRLIAKEPNANVAIIAPNIDIAQMYHRGFVTAEVPHELVLDQDFSFNPGVEITLAQDVKGLEFDYVVILEASTTYYPDTSLARRQLHVNATRAIHQLWVTTVGTPASAIRAMTTEI